MEDSKTPPPIPTNEPGARAIEIAAMLGDSVVAVRHLTDRRGGTVSRATLAMAGGAALLLSMSIFAFASGVRNEARNERAFTTWVDVDQKSAADFRPVGLGLGYDWMAFGGAIGGLALAAGAMIRARRERVPVNFRIGSAAGVDFPTDDAPAESFSLVTPRGDDFVLHVAPGMNALALGGGDPAPVTQAETVIASGARYRIALGQQTLLVSSVPAPRRQAVPVFGGWERTVVAGAAASIIAHLALVALVNTIPTDARALGDDPMGEESRYRLVKMQPKEDPVQEQDVLEGPADDAGGTAGAKMALADGAMGDKTATRPTGRYSMAKRTETQQLAAQKDEYLVKAQHAGVLGVYAVNERMWRSMTGVGDLSSGPNDEDIRGGLTGYEMAAAYGGWGYGVHGVGPGAGGDQWGTVGTGKLGLIGHDGPGGGGYGPGGPGGGLRKHVSSGPCEGKSCVAVGPASSTGDLDKNTIRRYIRRKLARIRNCYEKELMVKQNLAGTVMTTFQISPNGVVQGASSGGMGNKSVEGCVTEAIESIQFPKPKGGGIVNVRYPFLFNPAGG